MQQRRRGATRRGSGLDAGAVRQRSARSIAITTAACLVCLSAGGGAAVGAVGARDDAREAQAAADTTEIISIRFDLRLVHVAEANTLMLQALGEATSRDVDAVRAARFETRAQATADLQRIADGDAPTALEARALLEMLEADGFDDLVEAPPLKLLDTAWNAAFAHRPPESSFGDDLLALDDLALAGIVGPGLLSDGLDAVYVLEEPEVDDLLVDYVAESEPYLLSDGGYLGPEAADPLAKSYVFGARAPIEHPGVAEIRRLVVESDLWRSDQWITSWQEARPTEPAPFDLPELIARTSELTAGSTAVIDEAIAVELDARTAATERADARGLVLLGLAALLLLVPLGVLGSAVRRRFRAATSAAAQISIDPLTGVGNRNHLRAETEIKVSDSSHRWHLAAAIDMDRFKLINDTWGHAVGDRVLVEVAQRLTAIVDQWQGSVAGASGTVVRLGGDEFLLTLHAPNPVNIDAVRAQLDAVRSTWISVRDEATEADQPTGAGGGTDEHRVQLAFSVGVATAHAPVELDDLMHLADLASYEEKALRSGVDPSRRRVAAPGVTERATTEQTTTERPAASPASSSAGDDA